jgi:hypothetical protein
MRNRLTRPRLREQAIYKKADTGQAREQRDDLGDQAFSSVGDTKGGRDR